jgi:cyclomaltodextrinase
MIALAAALISSPASNLMETREKDWRCGPVVYHVFVDRFAPAANLEAKRELYAAPRMLRDWSQLPQRGPQLPELGLWQHELEFWGGDIASLRSRLSHIQDLGADVLYLNPIFQAFTNHKYDAEDYYRIDSAYGDDADFDGLVADLRAAQMKLVLDGVFNHAGLNNSIVTRAAAEGRQDWMIPDPEHPSGYRTWANTGRLIEFNLENPAVADYFWNAQNSVTAHWLKRGADGWRLDVAQELGFGHLRSITDAAHRHKPGSLVVGEVWAWPQQWNESMDGILNMMLGEMIISLSKGEMSGPVFGRTLSAMAENGQIEGLLRSWTVLGNHDTDRVATRLPDFRLRKMARELQFALPGAPLVYYGDEVGMTGGFDPDQRAPMNWDAVAANPEELQHMKQMIALRKSSRALRIGDVTVLPSEKLLAFARRTDRAKEIVYVAANPTDETVVEVLPTMDSKVLGYTLFRDEQSGAEMRSMAGTLRFEVPAKSVRIFRFVDEATRHDQYKRIDG